MPIFWNMVMDWLSFRFPIVRRIAEPTSLCMVKNGRLQKRNMRREFITEDELWAKLRQQGVTSLEEVKEMYLEPDGHFSIIKHKT